MKSGYTVRDLFTYGGFIAGIAIFMVSVQAWHVHHLLKLLCGVVVGMAGAWIGDKLYFQFRSRPRQEDSFNDDDQFGPRW